MVNKKEAINKMTKKVEKKSSKKIEKKSGKKVEDTSDKKMKKVKKSDSEDEEKVAKKVKFFKYSCDLIKDKDGEVVYRGRIKATTPSQAGNKVLTSIHKIINKRIENGGKEKKPKGWVTFTLKESTRYSRHKEYTFRGKKMLLDKPSEAVVYDKKTEEYKTIVHKYTPKLEKIETFTPELSKSQQKKKDLEKKKKRNDKKKESGDEQKATAKKDKKKKAGKKESDDEKKGKKKVAKKATKKETVDSDEE